MLINSKVKLLGFSRTKAALSFNLILKINLTIKQLIFDAHKLCTTKLLILKTIYFMLLKIDISNFLFIEMMLLNFGVIVNTLKKYLC